MRVRLVNLIRHGWYEQRDADERGCGMFNGRRVWDGDEDRTMSHALRTTLSKTVQDMVNHIRISISRFFARSLVLSIVRRISEVSLASSLFRVSSFPRGASFSLVVYAYASADTFRERSCRTVYGSIASAITPLTLLPTNPAVPFASLS